MATFLSFLCPHLAFVAIAAVDLVADAFVAAGVDVTDAVEIGAAASENESGAVEVAV